MTLSKSIMAYIKETFKKDQHTLVKWELESIRLEHVMAESECNLENTRLAVLKLSKGSLEDLRTYVSFAKKDFRDVIMWAMEDS